MFDLAKSKRVADDMKAAVHAEVEAMIMHGSDGVDRLAAPGLVGILNEPDPLQTMALAYLHGASGRSGGEVQVTLKVGQELVKYQATGRPGARGKHERRILFSQGEHRCSTRRAVWALVNYGRGVERNVEAPESIRQSVEEIFPEREKAPAPKRAAA